MIVYLFRAPLQDRLILKSTLRELSWG